MPEIIRLFGFVFFFYSREHEPLHVHVEGKGGEAKFELHEDGKFYLLESFNIKAGDMKKIKGVIDDNTDIFINAWNKHFGGQNNG